MICLSCRAGSEDYPLGTAAADDPNLMMWLAFHRKCRGSTWCDCQHVPTPRPHRTVLDAEIVE